MTGDLQYGNIQTGALLKLVTNFSKFKDAQV
jgi:hypothetical protein